MNTKINHYSWLLQSPPCGSGIWCSIAGKLVSNEYHRYHWFPDYFCPHIIIDGKGTVKAAGMSIPVETGDMFTIWPGVEIEYSKRQDNPWTFNWLRINGPQTEEYVSSLGFDKTSPVIKPKHPAKCVEVFKKIYSLIKTHDQQNMFFILAELYKLPAYTLLKPHKIPHEKDFLSEAVDLINSSVGGNLNVNELCEILNISRITLFRIFREKLQLSPIEYIMKKRIEKAQKILYSNQYSIAKTASLCGFNSEKYFIRCFKRATGQTPGAFRKNYTDV